MKHGLMILYQFINMVIKLHTAGLGFGHIDYGNLFIGLEMNKPGQKLKFTSNGEDVTNFTRDLLFMDPNLQNVLSIQG